MEERLQKILSSCGVGSRRMMEQYIAEGRVQVNGHRAVLGEKADLERDQIEVDGTPVCPSFERVSIMLNKPRGYVTTLSDEKGRKTVAQLVAGCGVRVWPIGRLDMDSEGLLLLTNDGALTNRLTHPRHEVEKEYETWVLGNVDQGKARLREPMELDGVFLQIPRVAQMGKRDGGVSILSITVHEGKNRQVRRMCAQAGLTVVRLKRIREGGLKLDPSLKPGHWKRLSTEELAEI